MLNWIDNFFEKNKKLDGNILSGNTPDGIIHLGAIREQLIADALFKQATNRDIGKHIFIAYDMDGLKKGNATRELQAWVGSPIYKVPCPIGCCNSFADHFLNPYIEAITELGIECTIVRTSDIYASSQLKKYIEKALLNSEDINRILERDNELSPYIPICPSCNRYCYSATLSSKITCPWCRYFFDFGIDKICGKLKWEVEWAALWSMFNACIEPIGMVHSSLKGRSYEKAADISDFIFNYTPPEPIPFASINILDQKCNFYKEAQCCKRNVKLTYQDWKLVAPPELLRFVIFQKELVNPVDIDIANLLPDYYENFSQIETHYFNNDENEYSLLYKLSKLHETKIMPCDFKSLVAWVEKSDADTADVYSYPLFTSIDSCKVTHHEMYNYVKYWMDNWRNKNAGIADITSRILLLTKSERKYLSLFWTEYFQTDNLTSAIVNLSSGLNIPQNIAFKLLYWLILQQPSGSPIVKLAADIDKNVLMSI